MVQIEKSSSVDRRHEEIPSGQSTTATSWPVACEDFSAGADHRFAPHAHPDPHVCFVLEGLLMERDGAGWRRLPPGSGRLSPGGDEHRLAVGGRGPLRCLVLALAPPFLAESGATFPRERRYIRGPGVAGLALRLSAELGRADDASPISLEMLCMEAVALGEPSRGSEIRHVPRWLDRTRERLVDDLRSVPTLAELAADAGVSRAHLARAFRSHFGCTAGHYMRARRLETARRLILSTETPLATVAREAGFSDQSHMTRQVAARFGNPPGRLRTTRRSA